MKPTESDFLRCAAFNLIRGETPGLWWRTAGLFCCSCLPATELSALVTQSCRETFWYFPFFSVLVCNCMHQSPARQLGHPCHKIYFLFVIGWWQKATSCMHASIASHIHDFCPSLLPVNGGKTIQYIPRNSFVLVTYWLPISYHGWWKLNLWSFPNRLCHSSSYSIWIKTPTEAFVCTLQAFWIVWDGCSWSRELVYAAKNYLCWSIFPPPEAFEGAAGPGVWRQNCLKCHPDHPQDSPGTYFQRMLNMQDGLWVSWAGWS